MPPRAKQTTEDVSAETVQAEEISESQAVEVRHEPLREMVLRLGAETNLQQEEIREDTEDFVFGILDNILSAETEEEIFDAQDAGSTSGKDFLDRPFTLHEDGLTFRKTSILQENVFPYYAQMRVAEISTGEEYFITCGGLSVVAVLFALRQHGSLNVDGGKALVFRGKPTQSGMTRLEIRPAKMPKRDKVPSPA